MVCFMCIHIYIYMYIRYTCIRTYIRVCAHTQREREREHVREREDGQRKDEQGTWSLDRYMNSHDSIWKDADMRYICLTRLIIILPSCFFSSAWKALLVAVEAMLGDDWAQKLRSLSVEVCVCVCVRVCVLLLLMTCVRTCVCTSVRVRLYD